MAVRPGRGHDCRWDRLFRISTRIDSPSCLEPESGMTQWRRHNVLFSVILASLAAVFAQHTSCINKKLDWYTSYVGETPCQYFLRMLVLQFNRSFSGMTYQRLRRICDSRCKYYLRPQRRSASGIILFYSPVCTDEVPVFRENTPGDNCSDQLST
jgi:hypothetical protein